MVTIRSRRGAIKMYISTKLECFTQHKQNDSLPIFVINKDNFTNWLSSQDSFLQNFIKQFDEKTKIITVPNNLGNIQKVICLVSEDMFGIANLPNQLAQGNYHI
ncbi:leucyl aminopeptidase family protein, partial [Francisella tularensis]|nr:leucyl aminopeptidase family protein [Francisella tularensis]